MIRIYINAVQKCLVEKPGYSPQVDRWELLAPSSDNVRPYLDVASMEVWADNLNDVSQIQAIHTGMANASRSGRARWVNGVRTGHSVFQLFAYQILNSQLSRYSTLCHDHVRKALPVSLIGHLLAFCLLVANQVLQLPNTVPFVILVDCHFRLSNLSLLLCCKSSHQKAFSFCFLNVELLLFFEKRSDGKDNSDGDFLGAPWIHASPITTDFSLPAQWGSPCGVLRFDITRSYIVSGNLRVVSWPYAHSSHRLAQRAGSTAEDTPVGGVLHVLRGLHISIRLKVAYFGTGTLFDASAEASEDTVAGSSNGSPSGYVRLHFLSNGNLACSIRPHLAVNVSSLQDYTANVTLAGNQWQTVTCMFIMGYSGATKAMTHLPNRNCRHRVYTNLSCQNMTKKCECIPVYSLYKETRALRALCLLGCLSQSEEVQP
jgi:hypothetical protein